MERERERERESVKRRTQSTVSITDWQTKRREKREHAREK
jgi:hypothetical protein